MRSLRRVAMVAGTALALVPVVAHAQASAQAPAQAGRIVFTAPRRDTLALDSSSAVTAVFRVNNTGRDTATVVPTLSLPRGWEPLIGVSPMRVAPNGFELWIAGVHAPSSAAAGTYVIRGSVTANGATLADSVVVRVAEHRAIEVLPLDAPGWILSGGAYEARFLVRNRGNVPTGIALEASSSRGARTTIDAPVVSLAPGAATTVRVQIAASGIGSRAQDDVIELLARDQHDAKVRMTASSRTTVVPKNGGMADNLATIPSTLTLRAVQPGMGVSPAAIAGRGVLPGTKVNVDYSAYVPAKGQSPFGDREEYHLGIRSEKLSAQLGDGVYSLSQLTSTGALSLGGSMETHVGGFSTGGYVQHSLWMSDSPVEAGAHFGTSKDADTRIDLVAVGRSNGAGLVSLGGAMPLSRFATVAVEGAASDSNGTPSAAERTRVSGALGVLSYDLTNQWSGLAFAGAQRGTRGNDLALSAPVWRQLGLHANAGAHTTGSSTPSASTPLDEFDNGSVGATYGSWGTVDYTWTTRRDVSDAVTFDGTQRSVRATSYLPLGPITLSVNVDRGMSTEAVNAISRAYMTYGGALSVRLPNNGSISLFGQQSDGKALGGDGRSSLTGGAYGVVPVGRHVQLTVSSTVSSMQRTIGEAGANVYGQTDARLDYRLENETTIGVRAHAWLNPTLQGARTNDAVYLEVRAPLSLPIGRQRRLGRVEGRVADAQGKPMGGVLVHVGDQMGVTDERGQVSLFGLTSGVHPISLDAGGSAGQNMLVGDATVTVDGKSTHPATFSVGVARGAKLRGSIRVLDFATSVAAAGDSLIDAGTLSNVTVVLAGTRDTLYQTSDDRGQINFGMVPPGRWTMSLVAGTELPEFHALKSDRIDVQLGAGDQRDVELQVVPRKRAVTFIGTGEALKVRNQEPKP